MESITLKSLLRGNSRRLGLVSQAGHGGLSKRVNRVELFDDICFSQPNDPRLSATILVLGRVWTGAPGRRKGREFKKALESMAVEDLPCLALPQGSLLPACLWQFVARTATPVFSSCFNEHLLASRLEAVLREKIAKRVFIHGALVNVQGVGVLVRGPSGCGKTTLALELARRGHEWIADDAVGIERRPDRRLYGRIHALVRNLLEIKGKGVLPVGDLLSAAQVAEETPLELLVEMGKKIGTVPLDTECRAARRIMGVQIPLLKICPSSAVAGSRRVELAAGIIRGEG